MVGIKCICLKDVGVVIFKVFCGVFVFIFIVVCVILMLVSIFFVWGRKIFFLLVNEILWVVLWISCMFNVFFNLLICVLVMVGEIFSL